MLARDRVPAGSRPLRRAKLTIRSIAVPIDLAAWRLGQARLTLERAALEYATACRWLGEANRRKSSTHRGAGVWPLSLRCEWVRSAFRDINRSRGVLRAARKALAVLEAA